MYTGITKNQFRNLMVYKLDHFSYTDFVIGEKVHIIRERTLLNKTDPKYSLTTDAIVESVNHYSISLRVDDKVQYIQWDLGYGMETKSKEFLYTTYLISGDADIDAALNGHLFQVFVDIEIKLQGRINHLSNEIPVFAESIEEAREIFKSKSNFNVHFAEEVGPIKYKFKQIT